MAHTIENIEITKAGLGYNLSYTVDGKDYNVTGEFYIDKEGNLHHTHIADEYYIAMNVGGRWSYVLTEEDVDNDGFVDIDPDLFMLCSEDEANQRKAELEDYAEEQGYQNITFHVEHKEKELEIIAKL